MVRIKNRYLLLQVLYPHKLPAASSNIEEAPQSLLAAPAPVSAALLSLYAPTPQPITSHALLRAIRQSVSHLFGEYGSGIVASGLQIKYWSNATSCAIIRCRREAVRLVWAACCFITGLRPDAHASQNTSDRAKRSDDQDNVECTLRCIRVSGTIRKCEEEAIRRARALMGRAKALREVEAKGLDLHTAVGSGHSALLPLEQGDDAHIEGEDSAVDSDDG